MVWFRPMSASHEGPAGRPERRAGDRMELLGQLRGEVMVFQPMAIRELSCDGVQVETSFPLQLDSLHELRLELGDSSVVVKGRVAHCSIADMDREFVSYRSGLEFTEPGSGVRSRIARFIEAVEAGRLAR
ncbi:MAG TPA: PilZ domain-containing protein [Vicinamibacterales bacterium]|nr:PilZ domain-containing protein [Vicinamibacterales bacterium]